MWVAPEERDPVVQHAPTRKNMGIFGAVRPADGRLVTCCIEPFNAETFQVFLSQLLRHKRKGRTIVVVLDNARWHHARALKPWLDQHSQSIRLDFLPPYSPQLNPIERVWKLTRRLCTHNRYFATFEELTQTVDKQFTRWNQPNEDLKRLCAIT